MLESLPPRERQIVDVLYASGQATVAEVREALEVELSEQAVRAMLNRLEAKGVVKRRTSARGQLFSPAVPKAAATRSALDKVVKVFFDGSPTSAATALLGMSESLDEAQLDELQRMIEQARKGARS